MRTIAHRLNRIVEVQRRRDTPDGAGGFDTEWVSLGLHKARLSQPPRILDTNAADQRFGRTIGRIYFLPESIVARGDRIVVDGRVIGVVGATEPSEPIYKRVDMLEPQTEPGWT